MVISGPGARGEQTEKGEGEGGGEGQRMGFSA